MEKLLVTLLAKFSNYVPEGGIWMNTQRPEWNDANNALVGYGLSMVTLYYLHRFQTYMGQIVNDINVDLLSVSAHKAYGPKGTGALFIRKGVKMEPLIHGGHHERRKRAGTENMPGIVGLGKAAEIVGRDLKDNTYQKIKELRDYLQNGIVGKIENVYVNGHQDKRVPHILNICFEYVEGESIILRLDAKGIAVSAGSACTSDTLEPSHVLVAMGVDPALSQGSVRFSLGKENTKEEMHEVLTVLPEIINTLREMSPFSAKDPFPEGAGPKVRHKH